MCNSKSPNIDQFIYTAYVIVKSNCKQVIKCVNIVRNRNGLKEGDASSPQLLYFDPEHATRKGQADNEGIKLHGTHQLLHHGDKVNLLGDGVHSLLQENTHNLQFVQSYSGSVC